MKWKMPSPDNIPAEVTKVVQLPPTLDVVLMSRLRYTREKGTTLEQRGMLQNVPHGEVAVMLEGCL